MIRPRFTAADWDSRAQYEYAALRAQRVPTTQVCEYENHPAQDPDHKAQVLAWLWAQEARIAARENR